MPRPEPKNLTDRERRLKELDEVIIKDMNRMLKKIMLLK